MEAEDVVVEEETQWQIKITSIWLSLLHFTMEFITFRSDECFSRKVQMEPSSEFVVGWDKELKNNKEIKSIDKQNNTINIYARHTPSELPK